MSESNAEKILIVYAHFKTQPGEALVSNHFLGIGKWRRWDANDLQSGLEEAVRLGLIERAARGWALTQAGYHAAAKQSLRAASV